jgi:hypothetical protein
MSDNQRSDNQHSTVHTLIRHQKGCTRSFGPASASNYNRISILLYKAVSFSHSHSVPPVNHNKTHNIVNIDPIIF